MADTYAWIMGTNGKPTNEYLPDMSDLPDDPLTKPYPKTMWRIDSLVNDGKPYHEYLPIPEPTGAFRNAEKLENVYIPESVKLIGAEAFRFTALKTVKIAADCEYSETSFPEDCELEFYGGGGTYGQLYDCDGCAILDCEAARIYVKSDNKEDQAWTKQKDYRIQQRI